MAAKIFAEYLNPVWEYYGFWSKDEICKISGQTYNGQVIFVMFV